MAIFGVWMWPKSVRVDGADAVVSRCKRAGVTDIYFLTKGLSGTASCRSDIVYKEKHPESGRYHYIKGRDQGLISLADEAYITYMADFTRELCQAYPIDGLHLDYIRYNHLIYGWSEEDKARYVAEGADIAHLTAMMDRAFRNEEGPELFFEAYRQGDESVHALARARRKDVVHFATTLTRVAREAKPGIILSAALMPEGAYEDIAFSDVHYGQNYEDAAKLYDYALPMAYSQAYGKDGTWVRDVALGTMKRGMQTIVGVHAYEGGTGETLQQDIAALKDVPVAGVCLFREGATVLAFPSEGGIDMHNPLDNAVTHIDARCGDEWIPIDCTIQPGEEKHLPLSCAPDCLRAFTGDKEVSIYLAR